MHTRHASLYSASLAQVWWKVRARDAYPSPSRAGAGVREGQGRSCVSGNYAIFDEIVSARSARPSRLTHWFMWIFRRSWTPSSKTMWDASRLCTMQSACRSTTPSRFTFPMCVLCLMCLWIATDAMVAIVLRTTRLQAGRKPSPHLPEARGPEPHWRTQDQQLARTSAAMQAHDQASHHR